MLVRGPFYVSWGCFRDVGSRPFGAPPKRRLNQPHPLQARMPVLADHDVVVHGNAERSGDIDDRLGHLDVRLRRRRVAGGMIVTCASRTKRKAARKRPLNSYSMISDHQAAIDTGFDFRRYARKPMPA